MTIRELMKVYKKVDKNIDVYCRAMDALDNRNEKTWEETIVALTLAQKAMRTLYKMAHIANVEFAMLMDNAFDEDSFIDWARANKLDFSKESSEETEEENDE